MVIGAEWELKCERKFSFLRPQTQTFTQSCSSCTVISSPDLLQNKINWINTTILQDRSSHWLKLQREEMERCCRSMENGTTLQPFELWDKTATFRTRCSFYMEFNEANLKHRFLFLLYNIENVLKHSWVGCLLHFWTGNIIGQMLLFHSSRVFEVFDY